MAVTDPVPARVDATGKAGLLALVDHAVGEGWTLQAACEVLKISRRRVERWQSRRTNLEDRRPGGVAVNSLLADEVASSVDQHARFGGVVPEIASRAHLEAIVPTMRRAREASGIDRPDAIAVTIGPGLAGALLWESQRPRRIRSPGTCRCMP